jgi:pyruvate dehydrogenase E1 component beta subunit
MNYGKAVKFSMEELAKDSKTLFIGYNLIHGSKAYGSLEDISSEKIIETPVAENLMSGLSLGLAIEGYKPVLIFERHDFMLNALDGLVNHLDKLNDLSDKQYYPKVIVRAIVGSKSPIYPGPQHIQDFTDAFRKIFKMPIYDPKNSHEVLEVYKIASKTKLPIMIIERRDLYNIE